MSDLTKALTELTAAQAAYEEAEAYSEGKVREVFTNARIRRALRGSGEKFKVNFARQAITSVLNRCEINAITVPNPEQQAIIDRAWKYNDLAFEAYGIHDAALTNGDTYVIVWPEGKSERPGDDDVAIDHNLPTTARVFYDSENPRKKSFAVKSWLLDDGRQRVNLYYPDRTERYVSKMAVAQTSKIESIEWDQYVDEKGEFADVWPLPNEFGEVPVFHFRTETPYGRPEHLDAYGPQNILNKLIISQMSGVDFESWPQRWALTTAQGKVEDETPDDVDEYFDDDDDEPPASQAKRDPDLAGGPGTVQWFDNVSKVGTFATGKPAELDGPIDSYVGRMAVVTDTPQHAYQIGGQPPTGESRRRAETPITKKTGRRQLSFSSTWRDVFEFVLKVSGSVVEDAELIMVEWEPPQLADDAEGFALVEAKVRAGIPRRQALLEAGYTSTQLDAWGIEKFPTAPSGDAPDEPELPDPTAEPELPLQPVSP